MGRCVSFTIKSRMIGSSSLVSREAPKDSYFLNTRGDVPFKTDFKPAVKVLSRKPTPKASSAVDSIGLQQLNIEDDEDDDEDDAGKNVMSLEERQQKALLDREEKQKKYEEARQRLFGSGSTSETQPREGTTPLTTQPNGGSRGQSKSRGGRDTRPSSFIGNKTRQLFDPNHTSKSDSAHFQKQEGHPRSGSSTPVEQQVIRNPRGPEKTGKGGFGFALRDGGGT
jgi:hypothetical protein